MKLHVFNDPHGFIMTLAIKRVLAVGKNEDHLFLNLNDKSIFRHERAVYLRKNIRAYRSYIRQLPGIDAVILYPLDETASHFLHYLLKRFPGIPVNWVFWSYEYYHRPDRYIESLEPFSRKYYQQHIRGWRSIFTPAIDLMKRILSVPVFDRGLMNESYIRVTDFYSFLPRDYRNVFTSIPGNKYVYHPISFLSIEEITGGVKLDDEGLQTTIMIGHSASITSNHAELIDRLSALSLANDYFIPLEYGDLQYGALVREYAGRALGVDRVEFLEKRLSLPEYYHRLSSIGFAVFNFRWQEGLGNILFLLWNGTKLFLREQSSVYQQFDQWGLHVFTIEHDLDATAFADKLSRENAADNRRILEELFSEQRVTVYWRGLVG